MGILYFRYTNLVYCTLCIAKSSRVCQKSVFVNLFSLCKFQSSYKWVSLVAVALHMALQHYLFLMTAVKASNF